MLARLRVSELGSESARVEIVCLHHSLLREHFPLAK